MYTRVDCSFNVPSLPDMQHWMEVLQNGITHALHSQSTPEREQPSSGTVFYHHISAADSSSPSSSSSSTSVSTGFSPHPVPPVYESTYLPPPPPPLLPLPIPLPLPLPPHFLYLSLSPSLSLSVFASPSEGGGGVYCFQTCSCYVVSV